MSCLLVVCAVLYYTFPLLFSSSLYSPSLSFNKCSSSEREGKKGPPLSGNFHGARVFRGQNFPFSIFHSDSPATDDSTVLDREQIGRYSVQSVVVAIPPQVFYQQHNHGRI